ncbi:MAG: NAD(P)H-hydrate dehydratase [Burkholderiaceae bacterium]
MSESRTDVLRARVLRVAGLRALESAAQARHPSESLMERAGIAVASLAIEMAAERSGPIVVLAGPGNNGGDALVAARELRRRGCDVRVALLADSKSYRGDASTAWIAWQSVAAETTVDLHTVIDDATLIIDGLFGIGFARAPAGLAREWVALVNASRCPVLAIDIASGVDADTGRVVDIAIVADRTLTFLARKPGLLTGEGLDHCGEVVVDLLGIERDFDRDSHRENAHDIGALNRPALFAHAWKPRKLNSHKGSNGSVAVVGGNHGMVGAALLASRMALHGGAGRVYVRLLADGGPGFDVVHPELMLRTSLDGVDANAFAIGPGLGSDEAAIAALDEVLVTDVGLVIDADALNAIAAHPRLAAKLAARGMRAVPTAVLTPHPLEAARLLGTDAATVQADRLAAATRLAAQTGCIVILKGAGSVIAEPSGGWVINPTGNPLLATGGTGDVLCGLVVALLAQSLAPLDAARAATWIHGTAADDLAAAGIGPVGMTASELIVAIRAVINRMAS